MKLAVFEMPCFRSPDVALLEDPYGTELALNRSVQVPIKAMSDDSFLAREYLFNLYLAGEEIAFMWLQKHKWKIQNNLLRKKVNKDMESRGLFLYALVELCKELHPFLSFRDSSRLSFRDYAHLFSEVKLDLNREVLHHIFNGEDQDRGSKKADTAKEREKIASLKKGLNPYDSKFMPAMSALMDVAIKHGFDDGSKVVKISEKYWLNFIRQYKSQVEQLDKCGKSTFIKNGQIYEQLDRGNAVKLLYRNVF